MPAKPNRLRRLVTLGGIALLLSACASQAPRQAAPFGESGRLTGEHNSTRLQLVTQVQSLLGTPYQYGGNDPQGFDCSGLVQYTYRRVGLTVPRVTWEQLRHARPVAPGQLRPGDLVFFEVEDKGRHVGIYVGRGEFIHAPSSGKQVSRSRLDAPYWRDRLVAAGSYL